MHPILFRIPTFGWNLPLLGPTASLPIYSYGVMLGLSFVVGWYLTLELAERDGLPVAEMQTCYVITALAAVAGSRLLYVVTNLDDFKTIADVFSLRRGGYVAYGGFLGGFVGSWAYLKKKGIPLLPWADVAVPSLATGLFITRIGCYLFGCDFGKPLSASAPAFLQKLGTFPHWPAGFADKGTGSPAWAHHYERHLVSATSTSSLPVHPTQLYESLTGLALFGLILLTRKHQKFRGEVFLVFTFAYGFARYLLEILRDDAERGEYGPQMAEHLLVPGVLLVAGIAYIVRMAKVFERVEARVLTQVLVVVPSVLLFFALRPASFAGNQTVRLSTSQWVAALTATGAAIAFGLLWEIAKAHPQRALAIDLPPELRPQLADDDSAETGGGQNPEDEEQAAKRDGEDAPKATTSRKKRKKNKGKKADEAQMADEAGTDEEPV